MRAVVLVLLAGCGRVGFDDDPVAATSITLTADDGYLVSVGSSEDVGALVGQVRNFDQHTIADCPVGFGPERWPLSELGASSTLYVFAYDTGTARGLRAQLEDGTTAITLRDARMELCAGDFTGDPGADPQASAQALLDDCNQGHASWSGGWIGAGGTGTIATGSWFEGYPTCDGVFTEGADWTWWSDGTGDPFDSFAPGPDAILGRVTVRSP